MAEIFETQDILEISPSAVSKIKELIDSRNKGEMSVRVILRGRLPGGGFQSEFKFVAPEDLGPNDLIQDVGAFRMLFDKSCAISIQGAKVDFDERKYSTGFHIEYPQQVARDPAAWRRKDWTDPVAIAVQRVIDEQINPGIAAHGGWTVLEDVRGDTAIVEMGGGCQGCGLSEVTLRQGIEKLIKHHVPEIKNVIDQTEHEAGTSPYYSPAKGEPDDADSPLAEEDEAD